MKPLGPIPPGFAAIDGELAVQGIKARELVDRAGDSPCFVYSSEMLRARVASLRAAMPDRLAIHYAMKANPFAPVLRHMAGLVDGLDVARLGAGLAMACLDHGISERRYRPTWPRPLSAGWPIRRPGSWRAAARA